MQYEDITSLLEIQGFHVASIRQAERKGYKAVIIGLDRTQQGYKCSGCGQLVEAGYDSQEQEVQHLSWWQYGTFLKFRRFRVNCPRCGIRTEALDFVEIRGPRATKHLCAHVAELCKVMTNKAVGMLEGLHRHTVKSIDKQSLEDLQADRSLDGITVLGADEISVGKGHHYWTMISALEGPRGPELLHVVEGRKEKNLNKFWKWFGKRRAQRITHAVIDMWKPFINSFKAHCPDVEIIYDKFHVIRHLLEALNKVRKAELRKASSRFKGLLAGKKFILLSRQAHVRGKARQALNQLLAANKRLFKAHLLKESFGHLWSYSSRTWALKFFHAWVEQLAWSRLQPYKEFAGMVQKHLDGILAHCDKKVSLGYIEATNLTARNVIRRAYGYRDKQYMKLKIIQAGTPWMNQFQPWRSTHTSVP
jgi:transposase